MIARKKLHRIAGLASLVIGGGLLAFWYTGHQPIVDHNRLLHEAIGTSPRIEIRNIPRLSPDGRDESPQKVVTLSDRAEIDRTLSQFLLPATLRASDDFHQCSGQILIKVEMPGSLGLVIRYDHGEMVYPVTREEDSPGYCLLPEGNRDELNRILFSLGYDRDDLGM